MKIVINFRITYNSDQALRMFTGDFWEEMALLKPNHEFIFITANDKAPVRPAKNVHIQKLKMTGIKWFDKKKLNKVLANQQADRFINIAETGFSIRHFYPEKERKKNAVQPEQQVIFLSNAEAQPGIKKTPAPNITVVKPAFGIVVNSLSWTEAESIKTQYAGGRSFFLFIGTISEQHQLVELLKAFSLFKKWQQSNMQLVIAGYTTAYTQVLEEKLLTYKYKADVAILKNAASTEIAKLLAACYAVLYPVTENIFPLSLLWAVQSNKAVIASDTYSNRQITEAAEWVDKNNTAGGFAKAMILLYKDEKHQQLLVQQTIESAKQFNRRQMLTEVWQCAEK